MNMLKRGALTIPCVRRLHEALNTLIGERDALVGERDALVGERDALSADLAACSDRLADSASPFRRYHACFDAEAVMLAHAVAGLRPNPGYLTNFLGVLIDPEFFPSILDGRAGQVEGAPIPANWHADISEWAAALRAVDLSPGGFTMIELGCGWGCWMNNTGAAARRTGRAVHLIGVEGDPGHISFARKACAANGFASSEVALHHGVAAAEGGTALFPRQDQAGAAWGLEPVFGATDAQRDDAIASGRYDCLPMIPVAALAASHPRIDLLHADIQGGEADLVAGCMPVLSAKVAYLLIGTHSRQIEGRLFETLLGAGWRLEIERPCIIGLDSTAPTVRVDGVQGWRNPALLP